MVCHDRKALLTISVAICAVAIAAQSGTAQASVAPNFHRTDYILTGMDAHSVAFDPSTQTAFVADAKNVAVVDTTTDTVIAKVGMPGRPSALLYDPAQNGVWVTVPRKASHGGPRLRGVAVFIDDATNAVMATVPVGMHPGALSVDDETGALYVADTTDDTVTLVDSPSRTLEAVISTAGAPVALATDLQTGHTYVAEPSGQLEIIDGDSISGSVPLTGNPTALGVDTTTGTVYAGVTSAGHAQVVAVDEATGTETGASPALGVAGTVYALTVNDNNHKVYAIAGFRLRFIDGATLDYNASVDVHRSYGVDVDRDTDTVYVAHYGLNQPSGGLYVFKRSPH
jgi:YVTN family beta-propeller protein